MKKSIYLFTLLLLFAACRQKTSEQQTSSPIIVEQFNETVLELEDIAAETRIINLLNDTAGYIGAVKDVCAIDSFLYVLDGTTACLSQFRQSDGYQVKTIRQQGAGPLEYIQPVALSADKTCLYLLDLPGMAILTYDKELNAKQKIKLTFPCMDFVKVSDGFLCYNPAPTETLGQIVYINSEGDVQNHYLRNTVSMKIGSQAKVFNKDAEGNVYITPFFSRTTYLWNGQTEQPDTLVTADFGSSNLPDNYFEGNANPYEDRYALPAHFFQTPQAQVHSFLYQGKRYYSFVYPDKVVSGIVASESALPFFPQWQVGNCLVGSCASEELQSDPDSKKTGESLLLFTLK